MNTSNNDTLLFVYNADSGVANGLLDYGKKYITPAKYECQLCMVSYGAFGKKREWKEFVAALPQKVEFLHRNEFVERYPTNKTSLPAVIELHDSKVGILVSSKDFETITTLAELIDVVQSKIK